MSDLIERPADDLYETDFYAWSQAQAAWLRQAAALRVNLPIDWENVAEEVESLGRSDRQQIGNRLVVLLVHLLKLAFSPDRHPRIGWQETVVEQRRRIRRLIAASPSLARTPAQELEEAYRDARQAAAITLASFVRDLPDQCPFDLDRQILADDWWPELPKGPEVP